MHDPKYNMIKFCDVLTGEHDKLSTLLKALMQKHCPCTKSTRVFGSVYSTVTGIRKIGKLEISSV